MTRRHVDGMDRVGWALASNYNRRSAAGARLNIEFVGICVSIFVDGPLLG
jgi:hypothetical protein